MWNPLQNKEMIKLKYDKFCKKDELKYNTRTDGVILIGYRIMNDS